jgi:hypothetical protein
LSIDRRAGSGRNAFCVMARASVMTAARTIRRTCRRPRSDSVSYEWRLQRTHPGRYLIFLDMSELAGSSETFTKRIRIY